MDPNATLIALLVALQYGQRSDAEEYLDALLRWQAADGFPPNYEAAVETLRERMKDNA